MPTGVRFLKYNKLNLILDKPSQKVPISQQISLWQDDLGADGNKEGYIEYIGISEYSANYDKYKIVFYVPENIRGYYKNDYIEKYLAEQTRFFFVDKEKKFILIRASKPDSKRIVDILIKNNFITKNIVELDLKELRQKLNQDKSLIESIRGAWIRTGDNANISTIAIFGKDIDDTDEFDDYTSSEESMITQLIINFGCETIAITHDYGAIFYNRRSEYNLLEGYDIVIDLLNKVELWV